MSPILIIVITWVLAAGILVPLWIKRAALGWQVVSYLLVTVLLAALGMTFMNITSSPAAIHEVTIFYATGGILMSMAGIGVLLGLVEFGMLRALGAFPLGAISRITYYEALLQPFTIIILIVGICSIAISARLSFFTYNEDFKMYRDVASSFVFLFTLPVMIFASTKVIDEEIENRTMLTLMSKPIARWQVVLGKYLGVLLLVFVAVLALGIVAAASSYLRYFDDMILDYRTADRAALNALDLDNLKAFMALLPSLVLTFLQVATLAAISVAVSTRLGLAANVTIVVLIYVAANVAQFLHSIADFNQTTGPVIASIVAFISYLLPGLNLLDLNQRLVFGNYTLGKDDWGPSLPSYGLIWQYVGIAAVYSVFYIGAALSFGMALFRSRELT